MTLKASDVKRVGNGFVLRASKFKKRSGGESQLVRACLAYLAVRGIYAWRSNNMAVYDPRRKCYRSFGGRKGVADILGILHPTGRLLAVECKTGTKQSEDQEKFQQAIEDNGGWYLLVHSVTELADMLKILRLHGTVGNLQK